MMPRPCSECATFFEMVLLFAWLNTMMADEYGRVSVKFVVTLMVLFSMVPLLAPLKYIPASKPLMMQFRTVVFVFVL